MPSVYKGKPKTAAEEVAARRKLAGLAPEADSGPALPALVVKLGSGSLRAAFPVLGLETPERFGELLDRLQRIGDGRDPDARLGISASPQFGKSTTLLVFLIWGMCRAEIGRSPNGREIYLYTTYSEKLTKQQKAEADLFAKRIGMQFETDNMQEWRTEKGNVVHWGSVSGGPSGTPGITCAICDDPYSGQQVANSEASRKEISAWFSLSFMTRVLDKPAIVSSVRWSEHDLFAGIEASPDWVYLKYPAISRNEKGEEVSLWPERKPLRLLHRMKADPNMTASEWSCAYLCTPMKPEANRFRGSPALYKTRHRLPGVSGDGDQYANVSIGCDLAYSGKGDYCALVVLGYLREEVHVLAFERKLCNVSDFGPVLREAQAKYGSRIRIHAGPNDRVAVDLEGLKGIRWDLMAASNAGNKAIRSEGAATAWNDQRLLFPDPPLPGQAYFISECTDFTGDGSGHDDLVDALSTAFTGVKPKIAAWSWISERYF